MNQTLDKKNILCITNPSTINPCITNHVLLILALSSFLVFYQTTPKYIEPMKPSLKNNSDVTITIEWLLLWLKLSNAFSRLCFSSLLWAFQLFHVIQSAYIQIPLCTCVLFPGSTAFHNAGLDAQDSRPPYCIFSDTQLLIDEFHFYLEPSWV